MNSDIEMSTHDVVVSIRIHSEKGDITLNDERDSLAIFLSAVRDAVRTYKQREGCSMTITAANFVNYDGGNRFTFGEEEET